MTNDKYIVLDYYSLLLKASSFLSVFAGLVFAGVVVYGWGQFEVYYNAIRAVLNVALGGMFGGSSSALEIPGLPVWPLIAGLLFVVLVVLYIFATLWALASWVDLKLLMAKEEREFRARETDAMRTLNTNMHSVAQYFAALPRKS